MSYTVEVTFENSTVEVSTEANFVTLTDIYNARDRAEASAVSARASETIASNASNNATQQALVATNKALEASTSAANATQSAQDAEDSAVEAVNILVAAYKDIGAYASGIEVTGRNQVVVDGDDRYVLAASTTLPYTTTGAGMPEGGAFVSVGDAALRQDLANPDKGAAMVAYGGGTVADKLDEIVSGAVTEPLVDTKVDTHNHDADAHTELRTSIVSEVSSHVTAEADRAETAAESVKPYVDGALSDLSTAANKFYPTLALANADIANILVNQPIHVGEAVNGGLWYKATSGATALTKSAYDPLTNAKNYSDSNPLFKPVRLESTILIDDLKTAGIYHVPTAEIAISLAFPDAAEGQLYVSGNTRTDGNGYVFQTYINKNGNTYQRVYIGSSWLDWVGNYMGIAAFNKNLNDFKEKGTYHVYTGGMATTEKNYPFVGTGGILTVMNNRNIVRQNYVSAKGTAQRFGITSDSVTTWQPWVGVEYDIGVTKVSSFLKEGSQAYKVVSSISELSGNLDTLSTAGSYFVNSGTVATTANGFPITGSGGFLDVKINASNAVHQRWTNINGYAYRWGSLSDGVVTWQPWRGAKNERDGIIDLTAAAASNKKLVVYGSSTMEYLTDELEDLAARKNLDVLNYAQSGDTIAGAALGSGANRVTIKVTGGEMIKDTYVPVEVTSSFGDYMRKLIMIELSNGVIGTYNPLTSAFYARNITGTMQVPSDEPFVAKSTWLKPESGVYIIDIGKNDVSSAIDNSQFIIDKTVELINNLPKDAQFIVGGHFSNTDSTNMHRTVVEAVNLALKNKYGLKYFDINDILFSDATWTKLGLTKTAADITAINERRLPPSLSRDNAHLSPDMDIELALVIENKLTNLGYTT